VDDIDRFAILRHALPQDRYSDDEVTGIVDQCCELVFAAGSVVAEVGQPAEDWLVVIDGELEVTEPSRRWRAGPGAIVQPCRGVEQGVASLRLTTTRATTVLQLAVDTRVDP
jgi:hypothetical protein